MIKRHTTVVCGQNAETLAAIYIARQGLKLIDKNYRCRFGEIDLIATDKDCLVFIEVRYRKNERHMAVTETIDHHKYQRLITTSEHFLSHQRQYAKWQCRFDFIGITGSQESPVIEWIKNAFQA